MKKIVLFIVAAWVISLSAGAQNATQKSSVWKATANSVVFEDFESWDGEAWDWLPEGWTDESKVGSSSDYMYISIRANSTWATTNKTESGRNCATVTLDLNYKPQDEWLISPRVTINQPNPVFAFDLNYDPYQMRLHYPMNSYEDWINNDFAAINNPIEVLISTDEGNTWEKEWDVTEDANSYTIDELWNIYNIYYWDCPDDLWKRFSVDLGKYVDEKINIAIRYQSQNSIGWNVYVDNISIDGELFTGLNQVKLSKNVKVVHQGDCFVLSYPAGTASVTVYNVAGQKIAEYTLNPGGTQSIPTAHLSKGVYVLKFAGKVVEAVKVIK